MYWLFKRYTRRLLDEYARAYDAEAKATGNHHMHPDLYWLQQYLDDQFKWESDGAGGYVRRVK